MSRGFVRENDQEEVPLVPQRAYLPEGVTNFVTRSGMDQLLAEKKSLINERENLVSINENEKRIDINYINAKLQLLESRIADARIADLEGQKTDRVKFGVFVTLKNEVSGKVQCFQITGVDEADISKGKISFISPLASALMNKKAGERIHLNRGNQNVEYKILEIK